MSWNSASSECQKGSQWHTALGLLQELSQSSLTPDAVSYSAATSACEKGSQWEAALGLLQGMSQSSLTPDTVSWSAGTSACEKGHAPVHDMHVAVYF